MNTRVQQIARIREMLEELDQASSEMRDALVQSNAEQHQLMFAPILDRLRRILDAERLGHTQFLADELMGVRSGVRRLRLPINDPDLDEPTPALRNLRSARGNLIEALDNALEAAAELKMHPQDAGLNLPLLDRPDIRDALMALDKRLSQIEIGLRDFAEVGRASNEAGPLSEAAITDVYARKIGIEVDAARFETRISDRVSLPELTRAIIVLRELGQDLEKLLRDIGTKFSSAFQATGSSVVKLVSRGYQGFKTVIRRSTIRLIRSQNSIIIKTPHHLERGNPPSELQGSFPQLVVQYLPYLRRYSQALIGSKSRGDALVANTLEAIVSKPSSVEGPDGVKLGLFQVFSRLFNQLTPNSESTGAENLDTHFAGMKPIAAQAFLLSTIEGFSQDEVSSILSVDRDMVRDLVSEANRELAANFATDVLIIEDEPYIAMDLEALVEGLGHKVIGVARTRTEALELATKERPGLILADIQLADGSSGMDAVNDIRKDIEVPVIFITAYPERFLGSPGRPEPAFLVAKPFEIAAITSLIGQALFFSQNAHRREGAT